MKITKVDPKNKMASVEVSDKAAGRSMEIWLPFAMLKQYGISRVAIKVGATIIDGKVVS